MNLARRKEVCEFTNEKIIALTDEWQQQKSIFKITEKNINTLKNTLLMRS